MKPTLEALLGAVATRVADRLLEWLASEPDEAPVPAAGAPTATRVVPRRSPVRACPKCRKEYRYLQHLIHHARDVHGKTLAQLTEEA